MAKIELYFGSPNSLSELGLIEKDSLDYGISMEGAAIARFKDLVNSLANTPNHEDNFFELGIFVELGIRIKLPQIIAQTYKHNGFAMPKMIIEGAYGIETTKKETVLISDEIINCIGNIFDLEMGFEYYDFKRIGKLDASKNDIIYLINGKTHIFHSGNFIEVKVTNK